jgi:hypothetical protein
MKEFIGYEENAISSGSLRGPAVGKLVNPGNESENCETKINGSDSENYDTKEKLQQI